MFRSYQTILRELSYLVAKLLRAAYFVLRWLCSSMHLESGYVSLSLLMCLLQGLATDTSTTKGAHNLIQMHAAT